MLLFGNKFYIIFILLWIFGLYCILTTFHSTSNNDKIFEDRIEHLQNEVESLRQKLVQLQSENNINDQVQSGSNNVQCQELKNELKRLKRQLISKNDGGTISSRDGPSLEYEQLRRKIEMQAREISYFTTDQLNKISEKLSDQDKENWKNVILRFTDQNRVLLASIRNLTVVDGYQLWREHEHESLSKLMQARLNVLQNPSKSCQDVKRVTCNINKGCGYGCEIHHAMHCFHIAYALGRPMILFSDGWRYNPGGFDQVFQPLSRNCTKASATSASSWGNYDTADVVEIPLIDNIYPRKDFMPMAIPEDISERLIRLHGNPFVWFTGQLIKYFLRPQEWLSEFIEKKYHSINFQTPIVGIHVRRTDKVGSEAAFHDISEYMKHVEDYYIIYQYQNPNLKFTKRVFLATDEPSVFSDARSKYPDYIFYGDRAIAQSAQLHTRYGTESLKGVLLDVHFLSLCDYLVCTFSSQICRVAYEVMQQRVVDGAWRVQPLDDVYYFGGQNAHNQRAIISHKAIWPNEFSFDRGDIIGTEGNHWDGFSKGSDKTNGQSGLYPTYKTEEIVNIAKMYTYSEVRVNANEV
ncbi:unnamed protein product [Rotaria sordida]|uniref:GT23 domain-containing protein n=1 Tax=Rotaria sordida TaxID=392033 RepID=A0A814R899_9BILA|nr:unnamed protein product [Rotaria sordida]